MAENKIPTLNVEKVPVRSNGTDINDATILDRETENKFIGDSEKAYQDITNKIINETKQQLNANRDSKKTLRIVLCTFIIILLSLQFVFLIVLLILNNHLIFASDSVVSAYVISVFAETLSGLIIMIKFAFQSKQDVELIKILNSIIEHFQKYNRNGQS